MKKHLVIAAIAIAFASCATTKTATLYERKGFFEATKKGYAFKPVTGWQLYTPHSATDTVYQYVLTYQKPKP